MLCCLKYFDSNPSQYNSQALRRIVALVAIILDWAGQRVLDDAKIQAFVKQGRLLSHHFNGTQRESLQAQLLDCFDLFKSDWELSTGVCMAPIWSSFSSTVSSSNDLAQLQALKELSFRFDGLAWASKAPLTKLAEMRASLVSMCANLLAERNNDQQTLTVGLHDCSTSFVC